MRAAERDERRRQRPRVADDLLAVVGERRLQRLAEGHRLGGDHVLERAALRARERRLVDRLGVLRLAQDQAAARAAQRLVRRGRDDVGERHRDGYTPVAASPAKCAMSTMKIAPTSSAASANA